jgi:recombination protein RecR
MRIQKLTQLFSRFPGIGPRQAKRFVYFLLTKDDFYLRDLSENILKLKQDVNICQDCQRFFQSKNLTVRHPKKCDICLDPNRDDSVLMIVGKDTDLENVEKNNVYNGKYFILGGYLPIMNKENVSWIRSHELLHLVKEKTKSSDLKEIIIALSLNPEGENTIHYIRQILNPLKEKSDFIITTLGKGLSTGTELEYSDDDTLKNALKNRS